MKEDINNILTKGHLISTILPAYRLFQRGSMVSLRIKGFNDCMNYEVHIHLLYMVHTHPTAIFQVKKYVLFSIALYSIIARVSFRI